MRAIEWLRPEVIAEDAGASEHRAGIREPARASVFSAGAIAISPALAAGVLLPRAFGPVGLVVEVGALGLRVWAMRTLRGHYAHALRVVDDQPVIRDGPYRFVRHPGYLGVLLLRFGAALTARNAAAPVLTTTAVGSLPTPHGRRGRAPATGHAGLHRARRDDRPRGAAAAPVTTTGTIMSPVVARS